MRKRLALIVVLTLSAAHADAAEWVRIETPNFVVCNLLAVLLTPRFPPDVREPARRLMGQIVQRERAFAGGATQPPTSASALTETTSSSTPSERAVAVFRDLKNGEQRIEGALERIECAVGGKVILVVSRGGELKHFAAAGFSDIDFITYRDEQGSSISCGERKPPDLVYLTWVPMTPSTAGIIGRPVAVEFLPAR